MSDIDHAPPVSATESVAFSCGCVLVIEHELEDPFSDCYIHPCGPAECPTLNALIASKVTVSDHHGVHYRRPVPRGP